MLSVTAADLIVNATPAQSHIQGPYALQSIQWGSLRVRLGSHPTLGIAVHPRGRPTSNPKPYASSERGLENSEARRESLDLALEGTWARLACTRCVSNCLSLAKARMRRRTFDLVDVALEAVHVAAEAVYLRCEVAWRDDALWLNCTSATGRSQQLQHVLS